MGKQIGVITAGGDSPGLNAAIRALGKTAQSSFKMNVIGFKDGFRGLMENRTVALDQSALSGILTIGGTILGTSRDKPNKMVIGGKTVDMTDVIVENYHKHHLDALVCLGGGGTQKNAYHLAKQGLNVVTLPKTIDNDIACTDTTIGFDTALGIATEAIDRLHSTAHSHHRIVVLEIMGHNAGWLALGAGLAGGADVILIPELPYDLSLVSEAIRQRSKGGKAFSIVAVAEGARSIEDADAAGEGKKKKEKKADAESMDSEAERIASTLRLSRSLEQLTGLEARVTILGHLQRGGRPSAADRILAGRLGSKCAEVIQEGRFGVMLGARANKVDLVPLEEVAANRKTVPLDHPWIESAKRVGTCLGN